MNYFYFSPSGDGWQNLAVDEFFLNTLQPEDFLLYFYVNRKAVIIGQNQNAWRECNTEAMDRDGVQLVRRVTGGGAVYHDSGNLNFSFIAGKDRYDVSRQCGMILRAVQSFGIPCSLSGRNDLLADGRKFSGNAFCARGNNRQHHGTLLLNADLSIMQRYLNVDPAKLRSKGVKSVTSRVCNLSEFCPSLTQAQLAEAVRSSCEAEIGSTEPYRFRESDVPALEALYQKHSSWEWRMGRSPEFDYSVEGRFPWGGVQLCLTVRSGEIADAVLFTDALDTALPEKIRAALMGSRFEPEKSALLLRQSQDERLADIASLFEAS